MNNRFSMLQYASLQSLFATGVGMVVFGGIAWLLMRWAEKRWNRPGPKRRLPR